MRSPNDYILRIGKVERKSMGTQVPCPNPGKTEHFGNVFKQR